MRTWFVAAAALFAAGCSGAKGPADIIGLPAVEKIDFDYETPAPQTPYGGGGMTAAGCGQLAAELRRLTDALGLDADGEALQEAAQSLGEKSAEFVGKVPERAGDAVYDRVVALNPARGVFRFLSRADKQERRHALQTLLLEKRRAYLRGQFDFAACVAANGEEPWREAE
jgi:hypothetical protein